MVYYKAVDVQTEINNLNVFKPVAYEGQDGYPLEKLEARTFERLLFCIYNEKIKDGTLTEFADKVELMQGIGEKGRDCILTKNGSVVGLIQCKHTIGRNRLSVSIIREEIIKFLINYIQDPSLITDENNFTYIIVTNFEFAEPVIAFLDNFSESLKKDLASLKKSIKKILNNYQLLKVTNGEDLENKIIDISSKIKFEKIAQIHLYQELTKYETSVAPMFFRMKSYVDNSIVQKILETLNDFVKPKFSSNDSKVSDDIYSSIKEYLVWAYEHYSYIKALAFPNERIHMNELYYPLTLINVSDNSEFVINSYPKELVETYKKILISSTAGMGKSTITKWMFTSAIEQKIGIPVYIELKRLKADHSILNEIIDRIKPISGNFDKQALLSLIEKGNFLFFLDGYDEIPTEARQRVTEQLQDFITKAHKNYFILTSRPEIALGSFNYFQVFKLKDLKLSEAHQILRIYDRKNEKAELLIQKIKKLRNIREFLKNPLLVSLLYVAYEYKAKIPYKKHLFYSQVYDALFERHDLLKDGYERSKYSGLDISDFDKVLRYLAFDTAKKGQIEYDKNNLVDFIESAKKKTLLSFKSSDFLKDLTTTVPLFVEEGNLLSWAHRSLQDYFAAKFIEVESGDKKQMILEKICEISDFGKFYNMLDIYYDLDYKSFRHTILYWLIIDVTDYFNEAIQLEETYKNSNILIQRKACTYGRNMAIKLFNSDESQKFKKMGKEKSEFIKKEFSQFNPVNWKNENLHIRYNRKSTEVLVLIIEYHPTKGELLRLLHEKGSDLVSHNHNLYVDSKHEIPTGVFFEITDDPISVINNCSNYPYVNEILRSGFNVNYEAFLDEKNKIEEELKSEEDNDILDF